MFYPVSTENVPYEVRSELHSVEFLPLTSREDFGWSCEASFQSLCLVHGETKSFLWDEEALLFKLFKMLEAIQWRESLTKNLQHRTDNILRGLNKRSIHLTYFPFGFMFYFPVTEFIFHKRNLDAFSSFLFGSYHSHDLGLLRIACSSSLQNSLTSMGCVSLQNLKNLTASQNIILMFCFVYR